MIRYIFDRKIQYILIALLILVFYGLSLKNGFVYDDIWVIQNNKYLTSWSNITQTFTGCLVQDALGGCTNSGIYWRPILSLTQLITYQISPSASFFHLMQLVYIFILAVLILELLKKLTQEERSARWRMTSFVLVIMFLAHPINSEVANWVGTAAEPLSGIFLISSLLTFIYYLKKHNIELVAVSGFLYLLALLSKESAIFFPAIYVLYTLLFDKKKNIKIGLVFLIPLTVYLLARKAVLGSFYGSLASFHNMDFATQLITAVYYYPKYLLKIIYPISLNHAYIFEKINFTDWRFLLPVLSLPISVLAVYICIKKKLKLTLFGLGMFFILLLPALVFVNRLGEFTFSERYLFLPMIGLLVAGLELSNLSNLRNLRYLSITLAFLLLAGSWYVVFNRSKDWANNITLWSSAVRNSKNNATAFYNLAKAFSDSQDLTAAVLNYQEAIKADSAYTKAYVNLGTIYLKQNRPDLAESMYKKALELEPKFFQVHHNLGNAYQTLGKDELAIGEYKEVLKEDPDFDPARAALNSLQEKRSTLTAKPKQDYTKAQATLDGVTFSYPKIWKVEQEGTSVKLQSQKFSVEFQTNTREKGLLPVDYMFRQPVLGKLLDQGLAEVPGVDVGYVRLVESQGVKKLQFFFFYEDKVIEAIVWPPDSPLMKEFTGILTSLKFSK